MSRVLVFINYRHEYDSLSGRYPQYDLVFASYRALGARILCIPRKLSEATRKLLCVHGKQPFSAVLNFKEQYVVLAEGIRQELGILPATNDPTLFRDKYLMRRRLAGLLPSPEFQLLRTEDDLRLLSTERPMVLKPRYGTNSMNVLMLGDLKAAPSVYRRQRRAFIRQTSYFLENFDFLAESYIGGTEHTVEVFTVNSEIRFTAISDKLEMIPPYFVETGDVMPSCLDYEAQQMILNVIKVAHRELEIRNGWSHFELKVDSGRIYIIEVAIRQGGGYTPQMLREVYGFDPLDVTVQLFIKRDTVLPCLSGQPRRVVAMKRFNHYGLCIGVQTSKHSAPVVKGEDIRVDCLKLLPKGSVSVMLGPPFSHYNTHAAFLVSGRRREDVLLQLQSLDLDLGISIIRAPLFLEYLTENVFQLFRAIRAFFKQVD